MRILLVEQDPALATAIGTALNTAAIPADRAVSGQEALEHAWHCDYDLILLGLALPDMTGLELIRRLRAAGRDTPLLVLARAAERQARLACFELGADDVLASPFDTPELMARLQAVVRRAKGFSQPVLAIGPLTLHLGTRDVMVHGRPLHLTGKEYAVLELLALRKGQVLTKDAFLNHLYGGIDEPEVKIIDVFICKLRKKLEKAGCPSLIGTVWGRGHVLREPEAPPPPPSRRIPEPMEQALGA